MSSIFISHSSQDNAAADRMRTRLSARGFRSLFLDFDPDVGIPAGRDWERELYRNLKLCRAVIVLCSQHSMASHWCFAEITQAKSLGKDIFPVKIGPCEILPVLTDRQVIDFLADSESGHERLWRGLELAGLDPRDDFNWDPRRPPYPGLNVFEEADAGVYFGRGAEIDEVLDALTLMQRHREPRLAVIVGASGCGKSSLVRAGIVPRLKKDRERWLLVPPFRPGEQPAEELARALASASSAFGRNIDWKVIREQLSSGEPPDSATDGAVVAFLDHAKDLAMAAGQREAAILVIIDQFEELLGSVAGAGATAFLRLLRRALEAKGSPLIALATLRSDFLGAFQNHPELREVHFDNVPLGRMPVKNFAQVIKCPADRVGIDFEPGLVERMVADTETDDALPLLAFTLRELYQRCQKDARFTFKVYDQELGGIRGAVERVANQLAGKGKLSKEREADVRSAFLKMVQVDDEGQFVRRPARWDELPEGARSVLEEFVESRLITSGGEGGLRTLEVAHEALFRVWHSLASWLDESREFLRWRKRFQNDAREWECTGRSDPSYLYSGTRLAVAEEWAQTHRNELSPLEAEFLDAGLNRKADELRAAQRRAEEAEQAARLANAQRLAVQAQLVSDQYPQRALLLAGAALDLTESRGEPRVAEAERALRGTLARVGGCGLDGHPRDRRFATAISPGGHWLITGGEGSTAQLWNLSAEDPGAAPIVFRDIAPVVSAAFSPDGRWLVTGGWRPFTGGCNPRDVSRESARTQVLEFVSPSGQGMQLRIPLPEGVEPLKEAVDSRRWLITGGWSPFPGGWRPEETDQDTVRLWDLSTRDPSASRMVLSGHEGRIDALAFSPDGHWLVTGSWDTTARLWDLTAPDPLQACRVLRGHEGATLAAAITHDSRRLVTGSADRTARLWDLEAADPAESCLILAGHEGPVDLLAINPDGHRLVTAGRAISRPLDTHGVTPRLWDLAADDPAASAVVLARIENTLDRIVISPDGRWLAAWGEWAYAILTDLNDPDPAGSCFILPAFGGPIRVLAFSPDGRYLVTACGYAADELAGAYEPEVIARIWGLAAEPLPASPTVEDGQSSMVLDSAASVVLSGHREVILDAAFTPDGRCVITASSDGTLRLWDLAARDPSDCPIVLRGHEDSVYRIAISLDGRWLATASADGTARLWDPRPEWYRVASPLRLIGNAVGAESLALSPDGRWLFCSWSVYCFLWDLAVPEAEISPFVLPIQGFGPRTRARFSPDSQWLVAGAEDGGSLGLWDLTSGQPPQAPIVLDGPGPRIYRVALSPDGRWLAVQTGAPIHPPNYEVRLWDLSTRLSPPILLAGHEGQILTLAFSPNGRWLATGGEDKTARLWDLTDPEPTAAPILLRDEDPVASVEFTADQRWLITGGWGSVIGDQPMVRLWDLTAIQTGSSPIVLRGHQKPIHTLEISPDGRWLATGVFTEAVRLWDLAEADPSNCRAVLPIEAKLTLAIQFSRDGRWLVTSSYEKTPELWDLTLKDPAASPLPLRGHEYPLVRMCFSPDSRWLVTADTDIEPPKRPGQTCRIWDLTAPDPVASAALLPGEEGGADRIWVTPDGRWLITAGSHGVRLWHLGVPPLLALARRTAGRGFTDGEAREYSPFASEKK